MEKLNESVDNNDFVKYLSTYTSLPHEIIKIVVECNVVKDFRKGTILLSEGEFCNECFLVLKGCIRSYFIKDGEEKTIEFFTEDDPVSPPNFGKKTPSEHYLECIEDTLACVSTPELEKEMFRKFPQLESECRIMAETMMAKYQSSLTNYRTNSPENRYLKLLKDRPVLFNEYRNINWQVI